MNYYFENISIIRMTMKNVFHVGFDTQYEFITTCGGVVFPSPIKYQTCRLYYLSDEYEVVKDELSNTDYNMVVANQLYLTMRIFHMDYLMEYRSMNPDVRYIFIPLIMDSAGADGKNGVIMKYLAIDTKLTKAFLFDPIGNDLHMLCQNIYYKPGSLDNILRKYCEQLYISYVSLDDKIELSNPSHSLLWCLWFVKSLIQDMEYPGNPLRDLLNGLDIMPVNMRKNYMRYASVELIELCKK